MHEGNLCIIAVCGNGNRSTTEVVVNLAIGRSQFRHIGRSTGPAAGRLKIYIDCALSGIPAAGACVIPVMWSIRARQVARFEATRRSADEA